MPSGSSLQPGAALVEFQALASREGLLGRLCLSQTLQLLDQRCALQVQEPRRLALVAAGALERALDERQFDPFDIAFEVNPVLGQPRIGAFDDPGLVLDLRRQILYV